MIAPGKEKDAYMGTGKMTKLELLRWILNKNGHKHGIFCVHRTWGCITKYQVITEDDKKYIQEIADKENIQIEIKDKKIYII